MGLTTNRLTDYLIAEIEQNVATKYTIPSECISSSLGGMESLLKFRTTCQVLSDFCLGGIASQVASDRKSKLQAITWG